MNPGPAPTSQPPSPPEPAAPMVLLIAKPSADGSWSVFAITDDGDLLGAVAAGLREGTAKLLQAAPLLRARLAQAVQLFDEIERAGIGHGAHHRRVLRAKAHGLLLETEGLI